jgi:hypothetical protein
MRCGPEYERAGIVRQVDESQATSLAKTEKADAALLNFKV